MNTAFPRQMSSERPIPPVADIALAAVFAVVLQLELWLGETYEDIPVFAGADWANALLLIVMAVAFAWRRAAPMTSFLCVMSALCLQSVLLGGSEAGGLFILILGSVYSVAVHDERWPLTLTLTALTLLIHDINDPHLQGFGDHVYAPIFAIVGFALGRTVRFRQAQAESKERRAEAVEADAREAVAHERARIAREIHDIVSHSVSVMVIQAGAAEQVVDSDPDSAKQALSTIQSTGRGAVDDLSRLLGLLRETDEHEDLEPQPGLRDLDALLERLRDTGLDISLNISGRQPAEIAPGAQLAIYRFVQEGATNVIKHARATEAELRIDYRPDEILLTLEDRGPGGDSGGGSGNGMRGLRERFAVYGGSASGAARTEGGFALTATLPLHAGPEPSRGRAS
ncbi:MAG: sensor histidine kinase [Solirubrobacterales bacterium]